MSKPIQGTWWEFQHHNKAEGVYWNPACARVEKQLEAVSPYVDTVLVYQYLGMMNRPGSEVHAGHEESARLYSDYAAWLEARK